MTSVPRRIEWAVEQMDVGPGDRILEIGCGSGHAIGLICARLDGGQLVAIDRSALQVDRARRRNRRFIQRGRARIEVLTLADAAPAFGERVFDKVLAVNVNAFWIDAGPSLDRAARLLDPAGRIYLVYEPPTVTAVRRLSDSLPAVLREHHFTVDEVQVGEFGRTHGICVIARPPRAG